MWQFFPGHGLWTISGLRQRYGVIEINTWYWGGASYYRGWRPWGCTTGAKMSMHKWFIGFDLWFKDTPNDQVRGDIIADPWHNDFKHITCLEKNVPHVHMDFRNHDKQKYGLMIISG